MHCRASFPYLDPEGNAAFKEARDLTEYDYLGLKVDKRNITLVLFLNDPANGSLNA